jgi:hypothetical protein
MPPNAPARFPIRFDRWYGALSTALHIAPAQSFVEVDGEAVHVRMAWAFRATFPRSAIASVAADGARPRSRGVHGFAGRWLVNGSADDVVAIALEPAQRARVVGWPVRLCELLVSVEDPRALRAALDA